MAEVAIAASAAGLASLGIQCCKGLTTYYTSFKVYDERIGAIVEQIQVLTNLFQELQRVLSRNVASPARASSLQRVDGILDKFQDGVQKLQSVLEGCKGSALPSGRVALLQKIRSRALFPFREETLNILRDNVQSMRSDLQLALTICQIDLELKQHQRIADSVTISRDVESISRNIQSDVRSIAVPVNRIDRSVELLLQNGNDTRIKLSEMKAQTQQHQQTVIDLARSVPEQYRLLSQQENMSNQKFEEKLVAVLSLLGTERELLRNTITSSDHKREHETKKLTMRICELDENIKKLQCGAMSRPSLLASAKLGVDRLESPPEIPELVADNTQDRVHKFRKRRVRCNCDVRFRKVSHSNTLSTWRFGDLLGHEWMYQTSISSIASHSRTCPMYITSPAVSTAQFSIRICGALLKGAAEISFSIKRGAGGFSISPHLHCQRVIRRWEGAFRLVEFNESKTDAAHNAQDWADYLTGKIQGIKRLFQTGQATPYDVTMNGETLLHMSGGLLRHHSIERLASRTSLSHEILLDSLITFCETLCDLGVPPNWISHPPFSATRMFVDDFISFPPPQLHPDFLSYSLNRLCETGLELNSDSYSRVSSFQPHLKFFKQVVPTLFFPRCHDLIEGLSSNDVQWAILHQSEAHLQAALQHSRSLIDEPNESGYAPLHLAINWPFGLSQLLEHGADTEVLSKCSWKPIEYAISGSYTDSVRLLLKAGCGFGRGYSGGNIVELAMRELGNPRLSGIERNNCIQIMKIVAEELALCLDRIRASTMNTLDPIPSDQFGSEYGRRLKSNITQVNIFNEKQKRGEPRLEDILPNLRTMYHYHYLTATSADVLWNAGFREIDMPNEKNRTPLMEIKVKAGQYRLTEIIELALWFHKKGALLHRPFQMMRQMISNDLQVTKERSERRAIHFVAAALTSYVVKPAEDILQTRFWLGKDKYAWHEKAQELFQPRLDKLGSDSRQFLSVILLDDSADGCRCACSDHGCMPVACFLRQSYRISWFTERNEVLTHTLRWVFENIPCANFPAIIIREIIRLITFEKLGLRHTCCKFDKDLSWFSGMVLEEANEIRYEDREGIQLLESLLVQFEEKRGDGDIKMFIDGYWATRMEEVRTAREEKQMNRAAIRRLGVILYDDDDENEDFDERDSKDDEEDDEGDDDENDDSN